MNLRKDQKWIILILIIFLSIRIPVLFIQTNVNILESLARGFELGLNYYCDLEHLPLSAFWQERAIPPGTYIYVLFLHYTLDNVVILIIELINMFLIYKLILRYFGKVQALNGLIFISFFPISIVNTGLSIDPIQIALLFILLGIFFHFNDRLVLSSISLAIGTLIIFIPMIVLVPLIIYYIKSDKYNILDIFKYLAVFLITIFLACLPFLLLCPVEFLNVIFNSLNNPHSINFLNNEQFFLTSILNSTLLELSIFNVLIPIKVLNLFQIVILIITIYYIYKRFQFNDEREIIISTIILISVIMIITFYLHFRFIYWIFMLSIIILSFNSQDFFNKNKIIFFGFLFFILSLTGSILTFLETPYENINIYVLTGFIFVFGLTIGFLAFGFSVLKGDTTQTNVIFSSITIMCYFFYSMLFELSLLITSTLFINIVIIIIIFTETWALLFFIKKPLNNAYKRGKIKSLIT